MGCPSTLAETAAAKIWLCYQEKATTLSIDMLQRGRAAEEQRSNFWTQRWCLSGERINIKIHNNWIVSWSAVQFLIVGGVLFLSCLLCWWSFLSVRRVVLKVGCVLTGFAPVRARKRKRWWLGSRARANPDRCCCCTVGAGNAPRWEVVLLLLLFWLVLCVGKVARLCR